MDTGTESTKRRGRGPGVPVPNLKEERVFHGYTVRGLAAAAGVDASTVNSVENGHRGVQASTLHKLAEALGVEARDLVGDALGEPGASRPSEREPVLVTPSTHAKYAALNLLDRWTRADPRYDRDVLPELQGNLNEDRLSHRKLFS